MCEVNSVHALPVAKLLKTVVARDGIEPPTPAFSGPLTGSSKGFVITDAIESKAFTQTIF